MCRQQRCSYLDFPKGSVRKYIYSLLRLICFLPGIAMRFDFLQNIPFLGLTMRAQNLWIGWMGIRKWKGIGKLVILVFWQIFVASLSIPNIQWQEQLGETNGCSFISTCRGLNHKIKSILEYCIQLKVIFHFQFAKTLTKGVTNYWDKW